MSIDLDDICKNGAEEAFAELDLVDLNVILYRADGEERDATGRFISASLPLQCCLADYGKVATGLMRYRTTGHWPIAVWKGGCTPSAISSTRMILDIPCARTFVRVLGRLVMSCIG